MRGTVVKLWPEKSQLQKMRLAEAITKDVMEILHYGDESVSGSNGTSRASGLVREGLQTFSVAAFSLNVRCSGAIHGECKTDHEARAGAAKPQNGRTTADQRLLIRSMCSG